MQKIVLKGSCLEMGRRFGQAASKYNVKTLVSFIAQPAQKRFWYCEGNPCKNEITDVLFE